MNKAYEEMYRRVESKTAEELQGIWDAIGSSKARPDVDYPIYMDGKFEYVSFEDWATAVYSKLERRKK